MKDNEVIEILPDGTVHYFDLDVCMEEAHNTLNDLYEKEGKIQNFDFVASVYTLFQESIGILTDSGWTVEELLDTVMASAMDEDCQLEIEIDFDDDSEDEDSRS